MKKSTLCLLFITGFSLCAMEAFGTAAAESTVNRPWSLRNHFTFTLEPFRLEYAEDNAEWRVGMGESGILLESAGFSISLADGRTILAALCGKPSTSYQNVTGPLGEGKEYVLQFAEKHGLRVTHRMMTYKTMPFATLRLSVTNAGSKPVEIKKFSPAVFAPGSLRFWDASEQSRTLDMGLMMGYAVVGQQEGTVVNLFHDPARNAALCLGVLPEGNAAASVRLERNGSSWQGAIEHRYAPACRLEPGKTLDSDTVWISYGTPDAAQVMEYFFWSFGKLHPVSARPLPRARWWTLPKNTSLDALLEQAKPWRTVGLKYVLIPEGWESAPGSLKGATPNFPRDMAEAVKKLCGEELLPGLEVDPLADEQGWVNPAQDDGRGRIAARAQTLRKWDPSFIVVEMSKIPDTVLAEFGLTREQANDLGGKCFADTLTDIPVLPAPMAQPETKLDPLLTTAALGRHAADQGLNLGPIRLSLNDLPAIDDPLGAAIRLWPGPMELAGPAPASLSRHSALPPVDMRPIDTRNAAPHLWQLNNEDVQKNFHSGAVLAFPGASAWGIPNLRINSAEPLIIWRATDGAAVPAAAADSIPAAQGMEGYGIAPACDHPVLLGCTSGLALQLDRAKNLVWEESTGTLRGRFEGRPEAEGAAIISIPASWVLKSGKVNGKKIKSGLLSETAGDRFCMALEDNGTEFELTFKRK